jgi:hypothetical protein
MPNHDELLEKTYALARENNKMLRKMRRAAFWGWVFKIIFWAIFLGVPIWLYFQFFQPVLDEFMGTYAQLQETGNRATVQFEEFRNLFDRFPGFGGGGEPTE